MKKVKIEHYSDKEALDFHTNEKSGKIEIISRRVFSETVKTILTLFNHSNKLKSYSFT